MSEKQVQDLIDKAVKDGTPDGALKLSQAALNAAHAMAVLQGINTTQSDRRAAGLDHKTV